jgi:protein-disulfide isomerase
MSRQRRQGLLSVEVGPTDHQAGPPDAKITLVEYGDFQCPWCGRAAPIVRAVQARFANDLRFVFRNFPLSELHPNALHAAEAAESVNATSGPEAYWRMHHQLFDHQGDSPDALDDAHLADYAREIGGHGDQLARDLMAGVHRARIEADFRGGIRSGVNGTPTFFINGLRYDGEWLRVEPLAAAIDAALLAQHTAPYQRAMG